MKFCENENDCVAYIVEILESCWHRRRSAVQCLRWTWSAGWPRSCSVHYRTPSPIDCLLYSLWTEILCRKTDNKSHYKPAADGTVAPDPQHR